MTPEILAATFGALLSLAFAYIPGLSDWYATLDTVQKRAVMAVGIFAVAVGAFGLSCAALYNAVTCDQPGAVTLLSCVLFALAANQSTFELAVVRKESA